jgi:hypothetical protein
MILFALMIAVAAEPAIQAAPLLDATPETYQAPIIRPFEPPSDFGREQVEAQGDATADLHRPPLTEPVVVDAYVRSYEVDQTDGDIAYDQGVAQAEIDADARMGPLDGRWRIAGPDGKPLLSLALTDRGAGRMIEGAWRRLDAPAGTDQTGVAGPASQVGDLAVIPLSSGELHLQPAARGWTGELIQNGRARPVTVSRAG